MAGKAVLNFLEEHNRPFTVNDIQQGVKGDFGKTAIQKALDSLVGDEKVREKIYGKQKIYCVKQENDASAIEVRESLLEVDRKINETSLQLKEVADKLKSNSAQMLEIKGKITLADALDQKAQLEKELGEVRVKLEKYSGVETVSPKVKSTLDKDYEKNTNEYKKRKRLCMEILNSILENYPKSKKHLFEEIGIETDEDVNFSIEKILQ
ncbi:hypothetical protein NQ315_006726 [Exocentrus adspersus]|uniref:Homologous-pairing protein 2 homolog n=1 Tax=Exocentrus adspersus TaxID=1586481 RepID=A0AAV8WBC4_9CUCU|nr:hypothetical protein NQ315_006726 [Exocentrus adspersus]